MCGSGQYRRGSPPPPPLTSPPKLPGRKCIVPPKGRNIYHQPCIQLEQILGEMRQMVMTGMPLQHSSNDMHCTGKSWNQSSRPIEWYRASFSSVVKGVLPDCYGPSAFLNGSQDNITSRTARRIPHIDILPLPGMPPSRASGRGAPPSRWWWRPCRTATGTGGTRSPGSPEAPPTLPRNVTGGPASCRRRWIARWRYGGPTMPQVRPCSCARPLVLPPFNSQPCM